MEATMVYDAPAHGSSRLEDRASPADLRGVVKRWGPDPSSRFYKLDEALLRDGSLRPLDKIVLMDLFHRGNKAERVLGIRARAQEFGVSHEAVVAAETRLCAGGYLLKKILPGRPALYLAAYPPAPKGSSARQEFLDGFATTYDCIPDTDPEEQVSVKCGYFAPSEYPQNAEGGIRKKRRVYPQNADTSRSHTNYSSEEERSGKNAPARGSAPPASLSEPDPEEPGEREELFGVRLPKQHPDEIGEHGLTGEQRAAAIGITSRIARTPSSVPWNDWPIWKRLFANGLTPDAAHAAVERIIARETAAGNTPSSRLPYYVDALEDAAKAAPTLTLTRSISIEDEEREWAERQKRLQVRKGLSPEAEAFWAKRELALAAQGAAA